MRNKVIIWILPILLVLGCDLIGTVPLDKQKLPDEISPDTAAASTAPEPAEEIPDSAEEPPATSEPAAPAEGEETTSEPAAPAEGEETTSEPAAPAEGEEAAEPAASAEEGKAAEPPASFFLHQLTSTPTSDTKRALPRHGFVIAVVLPIVLLAVSWAFLEFFIVRYVQPKGFDLSHVRIKAQDGMFIEATLSLTGRRELSLAGARMSWPRVREFVEKTLEQELIHEALSYPTLDELERNLKDIAEGFNNLPIVKELSTDFGLELMRFNVETKYPQETIDALHKKAEAAAGGTAYLAYAHAAHLDPDSREARELYKVYQETRGQVDAARNLGGGLTSIARAFDQKSRQNEAEDDNI